MTELRSDDGHLRRQHGGVTEAIIENNARKAILDYGSVDTC